MSDTSMNRGRTVRHDEGIGTLQPNAATTTATVATPDTRFLDAVRWGPILAGIVSTLATLLVLGLVGVAVGLTAASGDVNGAHNNAHTFSTGAAIWAGVSALIAFLIGGFVAGRSAAAQGKGAGWVNGALVWAASLILLLWLAASGATGLLNAIGFNLSDYTGAIQNAANTAGNAATNAANNPATVQNVADTARNSAWGALGALLLGLIAAGIGGLIGAREPSRVANITTTRRSTMRETV